MAETFRMLAKTLEGLEGVLAEELRALGAENIVEGRRSVSFEGDLKIMYSANYWLRTAISILKPIAKFKAEDEQALYDGIYAIKWYKYFDVGQTFAIDTVLVSSNIDHSQFASYKSKDAIVDQFNYLFHQRPDVDTKFADIRINVYISNNECEVSLNSSGNPLFKRGYRQGGHKAPINEVLAAGLIKLSGWDMNSNFIDPMCGTGTLLVEAALMAYNFPPQFLREEFAFKNWTNFDPSIWREIMKEVLPAQRDFEYRIIGGDISAKNLRYARDIIKTIKFHKDIELVNIDVAKHIPPQDDVKGVVIMNPPYGERLLSDDLLDLYSGIGDAFKKNFTGYKGWVISSDMTALKSIGLKTSIKIPMFNGALECRFNGYDLYEGTKREKTDEELNIEAEVLIASADVVYEAPEVVKTPVDEEILAVTDEVTEEIEASDNTEASEDAAATEGSEEIVAVESDENTEENTPIIEEVVEEPENELLFDLYASNDKKEEKAVGDRRSGRDDRDRDSNKGSYRGRRDGERRSAYGNRSDFDREQRRDTRNAGREDRGPRDDRKKPNTRAPFKPRREDSEGEERRDERRRESRGEDRRDSRFGDRNKRGGDRRDSRDGDRRPPFKRRDDDRNERGGDRRDSRGGDRPQKRDSDSRPPFKRRDDDRNERGGDRRDSRGGDRPERRDGDRRPPFKRRDDDRNERGGDRRDSRGGDRPQRRDSDSRPSFKRRDDDRNERGGDRRDSRGGDRPQRRDSDSRPPFKRRDDDRSERGGDRRDSRGGDRPQRRDSDSRPPFKRRDDDRSERGGDRRDSRGGDSRPSGNRSERRDTDRRNERNERGGERKDTRGSDRSNRRDGDSRPPRRDDKPSGKKF